MYVKSTHLMFAQVATHDLLASRSLCPQFHEQNIITALLSHTCGTFFLFSRELTCLVVFFLFKQRYEGAKLLFAEEEAL